MREYIRYAISLLRLQKSSVTLVAFKTFALLQHGFDASGRFTACLVQNNSLIKKVKEKSIRQFSADVKEEKIKSCQHLRRQLPTADVN